MKKIYLLTYNLLSALGWLFVLYLTVQSYLNGKTPQQYWGAVSPVLQIVQSAAILEILHAVVGLVGSSPFAVLIQVGSRLLLLWVYSTPYPVAQTHWSIYLMVGSWALVEVPRYAFYAVNLFVDKVFFPLFWARYTLFMILYPSGISGEVLQIFQTLAGLKAKSVGLWYFSLFVLFLYVPGSFYMYFHMVAQRKSAFTKRRAIVLPANGIEFPLDTRTNERSTTNVNKGAFEAAMRVLNKEEAERIKREKNWRFGYHRHVIRHVKFCAEATPEKCIEACQTGLNYLHDQFEFVREGKSYKMSEAMRTFTGSYKTGFVQGTKPKPAKYDYVVEYAKFPNVKSAKNLRGEELKTQLRAWAAKGTIEQDAADQIIAVVDNPDWQDLSNHYFVLLGAGSAMGPLTILLEHSANIIAIDLDRAPIWDRLLKLARESSGTMMFPMKKEQKDIPESEWAANAGGNLFTHTPEICNWLKTVYTDKPLVIGGYAYLDGALHVKVALAMDAVMEGIIAERKKTGKQGEITLGFLCTPTDVHLMNKSAYEAAVSNFKNRPLYQRILEFLPGQLKKNIIEPVKSSSGSSLYIVDGLVVAQGPNYALAKRMQHWRAMVAKSQGVGVCSNVAPSTATKSVVHNKQFAAAYEGFRNFPPMEVMFQETSNAVMGALLIHDIRNTKSKAYKPASQFENPQSIFTGGSFHGGVWRTAYTINSFGTLAAVFYYWRVYRLYVLGALLGLGATVTQLVRNPPHTW